MAVITEQIVRLTVNGDETRAEVVGNLTRCKDCIHYRDLFPYNTCDVFDEMATDAEDFCSYGERKETEDAVH